MVRWGREETKASRLNAARGARRLPTYSSVASSRLLV